VPIYSTPYQSQYIAWLLSRRMGADAADMLATTLVDAQVDLNPHQVEAALFAFHSPLSKGVILADEVGLGKTIEAGLVIAQRWAERKRHILVITPANLRKQWHQELQDKFSLQAQILEAKSYRDLVKAGTKQPFDQARVLICSYQFAKTKVEDLKRVPWDLVVMDEAHRLRNVYKPSNVIGKALKEALANAPKVLLTATPLQNSLLELYGLVSLVDERVFGDLPSFRDQFGTLNNAATVAKLRERLQPVCMRTLRRQVQPYISYTKRIPLVEQFTPSQDEQVLRDMVTVAISETVCRKFREGGNPSATQHVLPVDSDARLIRHAVRDESATGGASVPSPMQVGAVFGRCGTRWIQGSKP
jgi:SNF2 family DNA or RNA helicase